MRWTLVIIIILSIEIYAFQSFKTLFKFNWISKVFLLINFLIYISNDNKTIIERRDNNGIWQKLYQFPLVESDKELDANALLQNPQIQKKLPSTFYQLKLINVYPQVHNLSHRKLYIKFWEIRLKNIDGNSTSIQNLDNFPFPIVLTRFINSYFQNN